MTNYEKHFKALSDSGLTDAEIVTTLKQDTRHHRKIMATSSDASQDLRHIMLNKFRVAKDDKGSWSGPLRDVRDDLETNLAPDYIPEDQKPTVDALIRDGIDRLMGEFTVTNRPVFCDSDPQTGLLTTIISEICDGIAEAQGFPANSVTSAVHAITGGPIWAGLTVEQIQDARTNYQTEQAETIRVNALQSVLDECNNLMNAAIANGDDAATFRATLKAGL